MPRASLSVLGSSSGIVQADRACSGYLIDTEDSLTLLDCGSGIIRSLVKFGCDINKLDRIAISHTHPDHVGELPHLIQYLHLAGRTIPVDLFLPEEFVGPFRDILSSMYAIPERFAFDLCIHGYHKGVVVDQPLRIEAIPNGHLEKYAADIERLGLANRMQSYSLKISVGGVSVFYSSDIASFGEIWESLQSCHVALVETTHVDVPDVVVFARDHRSIRIVLTHLGDKEEVSRIRATIFAVPNVQIAEDGMRVDLTPSLPSSDR